MALYELSWANIEVSPVNRNRFFWRFQGVGVTCFSKGTWRPWWCLWLCTADATIAVDSISLSVVLRRPGGVIPSSDQVQKSDSLEVGEVLSGINVPALYTGVSCTGTVIQGDDVFRFSENFAF